MEKFVMELQEKLGEEGLKLQEPMKEHTTFRVGGPADLFLMPADAEELKDSIEILRKYDVPVMIMTGFLDGINDSLVEPNPIEEMEEDTVVNLGFDKVMLYKNMVAAKADWLYELEEWNDIFDEETRKTLYKEQKASTTVVKETKVYPNDPCPCGSGKKYKKCCGKK